jgi:hypothetical protein
LNLLETIVRDIGTLGLGLEASLDSWDLEAWDILVVNYGCSADQSSEWVGGSAKGGKDMIKTLIIDS